jgi:hypothetical protein
MPQIETLPFGQTGHMSSRMEDSTGDRSKMLICLLTFK